MATTTTTSSIDPALLPYLQTGLQRAEQLFLTGPQPTFFPGQTYVSPSEQTLSALSQTEQLAQQASPALQAGQQAYLSSLGGLGQTASGAFLQGSPLQQAAIQAATRPLQQQFAESTLPALQSAFSRAGRYGSGAQERAISQAQEATSRAIGDVATNIAYQDYARERGLQQQAQAQQAALGAYAPQFYQQQFLPAQTLAQVGAQREAIAMQPLQEEMSRFAFQQQQPVEALMSYLSGVYGTPLARVGTTTQTAPQSTNYLAQGLGGALLGSQVGGMFGGFGGLSGSQTGAILGGLGGLLF